MKIITWVSLVLLTAGCGSQTIPAEYIYVGTAGNQEDSGLYVFGFDRENNELNPIQTIDDHSGPNFQALHPDGTFLYSVSGEAFSDDDESGTLTAYRIDQNTGKLSMVNEQSAEGRGPCHVSVDPLGRFVYVSNYSSGNLSVYAINGDGTLEPAADRVQHEGSSIHASRQKGPYMHSIIPSADGKFI
ncbi:MAG: beta-propeller fold lactonase family protein, partial [Balneolales bacterium]